MTVQRIKLTCDCGGQLRRLDSGDFLCIPSVHKDTKDQYAEPHVLTARFDGDHLVLDRYVR